MVHLVEDWAVLEKNVGNLPGLYQVLENDKGVEIRVWIGSCGFKAKYANVNDPEFVGVLDFCKKERYTRFLGSIQDSLFFEP